MNDSIIKQQLSAIYTGFNETWIEILKSIRPLNWLIAGVRGYHDYFIQQQRKILIKEILERLNVLEDVLKNPWYKSDDGEEVLKKTISSALNAEFTDKLEFFANIIFNSQQDVEQLEKLKFIDMVRQLSKAAIRVLAEVIKTHQSLVGLHQVEQIIGNVISHTEINDRDHVKACINELIAVGLLHLNVKHIAANDFTVRFVDFIKDPRISDTESKTT